MHEKSIITVPYLSHMRLFNIRHSE